jgi:hypothetical protein
MYTYISSILNLLDWYAFHWQSGGLFAVTLFLGRKLAIQFSTWGLFDLSATSVSLPEQWQSGALQISGVHLPGKQVSMYITGFTSQLLLQTAD